MAESVDFKLIERLVNSGSEEISYVAGVAGTSGSNVLWRRFARIRFKGRICQVVKCKSCDFLLRHRTGSAYDSSQGRSSGTSNLRKHVCSKNSQPPITALLKKEVPEGAVRVEKRALATALSDVCAEDLRGPFHQTHNSNVGLLG